MSALFAATHVDRVIALVMYGSYAKGSWAEDYPWGPKPEQTAAGVELIDEGWGHGFSLEVFAPSFAEDPKLVRWWARYERQASKSGDGQGDQSPRHRSRHPRDPARDSRPNARGPPEGRHRRAGEGARYIAERIPAATPVELSTVAITSLRRGTSTP
jgi:hypothetical protein